MSINADLKSLYNSWKQPGLQFVSGGVVDEPSYCSSSPKLMMLLKEVNDPNSDENWSLVDLIQKQIDDRDNHEFLDTWRNVGIWSYGVHNGYAPYQDIVKYYKQENLASGLQCIATTNLKKSGGGGISNYDEIKANALKQKDLWTEEIKIMKPDVVICGGTFSIVKEILGFDEITCSSGADTGRALDTLFVDFYHPQYRISPKVLYAYFCETMESLGFSE